MKKNLILYFIIAASLSAFAQPEPITFQMAVSADKTVTQKDLYKKGKKWFSDIFIAPNKTVTLDDASQGVIVGTANFPYESKVFTNSAKTKGTVQYQLKLRFKDGRYEYEITNFKHTGAGISFGLITKQESYIKEIAGVSQEWKNEVWQDLKTQAEANSKEIIKSLISEVSKVEYNN